MLTHYFRDTSKFDSHLYTDDMGSNVNADFFLILRVHLKKGEVGTGKAHDWGYNPSASAADIASHTFDSLAFTDTEWTNLKKKFKEDSEAFWTGKFWMVPQASYPELVYPTDAANPPPNTSWVPTVPPVMCNLYCALTIQVLDSPADAHKTITIYKVPAGRFFRADSATYTKEKIDEMNPQTDQCGKALQQRTLFHEVGHALGLPHIGTSTGVSYAPGKVCVASDDADALCYTGKTCADTASIMGRGSALSVREADPWMDRINTHTNLNRSNWQVSLMRVAPARI